MPLSYALNSNAHGGVHELLGGTWSKKYGELSERLTRNVLPFLYTIQVRIPGGKMDFWPRVSLRAREGVINFFFVCVLSQCCLEIFENKIVAFLEWSLSKTIIHEYPMRRTK